MEERSNISKFEVEKNHEKVIKRRQELGANWLRGREKKVMISWTKGWQGKQSPSSSWPRKKATKWLGDRWSRSVIAASIKRYSKGMTNLDLKETQTLWTNRVGLISNQGWKHVQLELRKLLGKLSWLVMRHAEHYWIKNERKGREGRLTWKLEETREQEAIKMMNSVGCLFLPHPAPFYSQVKRCGKKPHRTMDDRDCLRLLEVYRKLDVAADRGTISASVDHEDQKGKWRGKMDGQ